MKRLFAVALFATTFLAISCQKETSEGEGGGQQPVAAVPADFDWKMTRDVSAAVGMPSVSGLAPDYAVVRIYSSPVLADGNIVAMGVVKASQPVFSTAMTLPAGVRNLYVQTTLPDGTVSVSMQPVSAALNVAGAVMKSAEAPKIRISAATRSESSSMPGYPTLSVKAESDFAEGAVIRQTPAGNINLNGKFSPHSAPVLYVAGKLTLDTSVTVGQATLAVLPGGEVYIKEAKANLQQNAVNPAIYVFEGGTFTTDKTSFSCKTVVNEGTFVVNGLFNVNTSCEFYNGASAALQAGEVEVTNKAKLYNDGKVESADFRLNTYA